MSDDMDDHELKKLSRLVTPAPSADARQRALDAAMLAFDTEQKKSQTAPQVEHWTTRLRSVVQNLKGSWIMDTRISLGLGTAAVALLLLPLGYQLYTSTVLTPVDFEQRDPVGPITVDPTVGTDQPEGPVTLQTEVESEPVAEPGRRSNRTVTPNADGTLAETTAQAPLEGDVPLGIAAEPVLLDDDLGAAADTEAPRQEPAGATMKRQVQVQPVAPSSTMASPDAMAGGMAQPMTAESVASMPAPEPMIAMPTDPSGDEFTEFTESPVKVVAEEPVSTFSIDVDTASYTYVRRMLTDGYLPEPDSIRIEEMINYFDYDYAGPDSAATPFKANMQIYPTPWNPKTQLVQIGIKGYVPPVTEDKASNLVFLLDTSGSMDEPDKLPLLKRAFTLLVDQLSANDTVSIVAYAGSAGVVLEPTKAMDKAKILGALENLWAGGSTAGAEGIELAYRLAAQNMVDGGINRVILATDGDFNVGIDDPEDLVDFIKNKRDQGIFLSVLGFGQGNLGDDTMQALAQNGNGNASYIDSYKEAQKVLVAEIGGTLETIAKDVKIQVEFNPAVVAEYRLVGYETRALNREDFNNDKVDAGDIGAGHTVTAIYEITPVGSGGELVDPLRYGTDTPTSAVMPSDEIGFLKMRYKLPEGTVSQLIETPITKSLAVDSVASASEDARWAAAVAAFAQKLKGSSYGGTMSYDEIRQLAQGARGTDENGYRAEFIQLINSAAIVDPND